MELQKLRHDRTELFTRGVQPVLWLLIFGKTFSHLHAIPTGNLPYLDFLAPGIVPLDDDRRCGAQARPPDGVGQMITMPLFFASNALYRRA